MATLTAEGHAAIDPALSSLTDHTQPASPALATRVRPEQLEQARSLDPQLAQAALDLELDNSRAQLALQTGETQATHSSELIEDAGLTRTNSNAQPTGADLLRPVEPVSPSQESSVASPSRERLPSISQLTQQLTTHSLPALAEAATQQEARQQQFSHQHSHSYGSNGPQSPVLTHHTQSSPGTFAAFPNGITARSPTNAVGDTPYYQSPSAYGPYGFYAHRRPSAAAGDQPMPLPPTGLSASSSTESAGPPGSIDGYSTAHTTPIDPSQAMDVAPQAMTNMLPPPPGGFKCPYEGCTAAPFQTQYLLTSHKNVHSQDRPHYCPVKDCPRGEGGKGFKRKNEMIRHGLVHKSPGYICPFCPEREHRYPRPDNLQRHVRVHHVDKDRDDPALQEVLNQRTEGQGKTRRRRTTMTTITASS